MDAIKLANCAALDWITAEPVPDMDATLGTLINVQLG
jgi:hypothetical protein